MDGALIARFLYFGILFQEVLTTKHIRWGDDPCILIDIDAYNNLEWIERNGTVSIATNFTFDDVDITEGGCNLPNPWVGGLWQDGKSFELVFYNNSGVADVQMNIYYNPSEVFKHNLSENVRNIVSFPTSRIGKAYRCQTPVSHMTKVHVENVRNIVSFPTSKIGKAYRCQTPVSHMTKVHVGKEAYRYSFGINSILIQGFGVNGQKYSTVEECPQDMTSSRQSTHSTKSTHTTHNTTKPSSHSSSHSTKPSSHSTHSITHSTHSSTHSTHPSTHSTKPSTHSTHPSTHSTHPSTHSTHPSTHSTHPSTHSTHPSTHSTHPSTHSTHPSTHSTHPSTHSTHPSTHSTHPSTRPTQPPIPDDPSIPSNVSFDTACMKMVGNFQLNISYPTSTPGTNKSVVFSVNDINSVNGSCGNASVEVLYVTFYNNWQMNITLKTESSIMGKTDGGIVGNTDHGIVGNIEEARMNYWWSHLYLQYLYNTTTSKTPYFPGIDPKQANGIVRLSKSVKKKMFEANITGSYVCNADRTINLGYGTSLTISNLQYVAFQNNPNTAFSNIVTECTEDKHRNKGNTYIYVGVGLGVLVAMVMVIYIAGRCCYRRNYEEL